MRFSFAIVGVLLAVAAANAGEGLLQERKYKWWQSEEVREALELTDDQASRIEEIFQETLPKLRTQYEDLDEAEDELSRLLRDDDVTEAEVSAQVDRVERARSALSKTRTLMLFRMHRTLSSEQRVELRQLDRQRHGDRR